MYSGAIVVFSVLFYSILWLILFYSQDCQTMVPTPAPQPGERRSVQSFDVRLSTLHESTIDLLFSKNKVSNCQPS
jgi:hypothetical protein